MLRSSLSLGLAALALAASAAHAQSVNDPSISIDSLAPSGLAAPTTMAFVAPNDILVLEKEGRVRRLRNGVLWPTPVPTVLADNTGERGLLGIAVDGSTTPVHVFLYYSELSAPLENGGSILGTSRTDVAHDRQMLDNSIAALKKLGIEALVAVGGDDMLASAAAVERHSEGAIKVVQIPKSIDNDLPLPASLTTLGY